MQIQVAAVAVERVPAERGLGAGDARRRRGAHVRRRRADAQPHVPQARRLAARRLEALPGAHHPAHNSTVSRSLVTSFHIP